MSLFGGTAAKEQPKKKKGPGAGSAILLSIVLLFVVLTAMSCINNANEPDAVPTPTAEPVVSVDAATVTKVKTACVAQVTTVAKYAAREIAGVKPRFYTIASTSFGGDVEEVSLPRNKTVYEVEFTYVTKHDDGSQQTTEQTCRVSDDFGFTEMRR